MAQSPPAIGNPLAFGLFCFGVAAFITGAFLGGWLGLQPVIAFALFTGGIGVLGAGIFAMLAGNTFAGTVFCTYGLFWVSLGFYLWFLVGATKNLPNDLTWVSFVWLVISVVFLMGFLKTDLKILQALIAVVALLFAALWIGDGFGVAILASKVAGVLAIVAALIAFYQAHLVVQGAVAPAA